MMSMEPIAVCSTVLSICAVPTRCQDVTEQEAAQCGDLFVDRIRPKRLDDPIRAFGGGHTARQPTKPASSTCSRVTPAPATPTPLQQGRPLTIIGSRRARTL